VRGRSGGRCRRTARRGTPPPRATRSRRRGLLEARDVVDGVVRARDLVLARVELVAEARAEGAVVRERRVGRAPVQGALEDRVGLRVAAVRVEADDDDLERAAEAHEVRPVVLAVVDDAPTTSTGPETGPEGSGARD
jgi:hypothetical protein